MYLELTRASTNLVLYCFSSNVYLLHGEASDNVSLSALSGFGTEPASGAGEGHPWR